MVMSEALKTMFLGGAGGLFVGSLLIVGVLLSMGIYIYTAFSWMTIAKKLKYKTPWLAWIPFANIAMMLELGGFNWAWIFLILIPFAGWIAIGILLIIATWKIFEKRKYPGWFSLSIIIPWIGAVLYLIAIGVVAWKDK